MASDAWPVGCLIFRDAGAHEVELRARRADRVAEIAGGGSIFIESEITVTALGRPRLGGAAAAARAFVGCFEGADRSVVVVESVAAFGDHIGRVGGSEIISPIWRRAPPLV